MRRLVALAAVLAAVIGLLFFVLDEPPAPVHGSEPGAPEEGLAAKGVEPFVEPRSANETALTPVTVAEQRVAVERGVVTGRVIEEGSGAPVPGARVTLSRRATVLARATSGPEGRFQFDAPEGAECSLLVEEAADVEFPGAAVFVDLTQLAEEYVLLVSLPPAAPLAVRIVDAATDEPVPAFSLELSSPNGVGAEELTTDSEGRFRSSRSYHAGALVLTLREALDSPYRSGASDPRIEHDPADPREHVVPIRIGPTYFLDFDPPPGLEPEAFTAELRSERSDESPWGPMGRETPVRPGRPPRVRFSKHTFADDPSPPWRLSLHTDAGGWHGSARVDSITGIQPNPVRIELRQGGRLAGRILDVSTNADWAFVELSREGAPPRVEGPFNEGTYSIGELVPGAYRVAAYSRRCALEARPVTVTLGGPTLHDLVLAPRPVGGSIAGTVRSERGARIDGIHAILRPTDRPKLVWTQRVQWPEGAGEGTFRFDGVPEGEYRILLSLQSRAEPPAVLVRPPEGEVRFLVRDDMRAVRDYRLRAVDATTGECISRPELESRRPPAAMGIRQWTSGCWLNVTGTYDVGDHFEWVLRCDGYETAWGDEASFAESDGDDEPWTCEARLRKGWSGRVRVVDEDGVPLAGASVRFDDGPAEPTGADGRLETYRTARPARLSVTLGSRRVARGDVDDEGVFADSGFDIEIVMSRPE